MPWDRADYNREQEEYGAYQARKFQERIARELAEGKDPFETPVDRDRREARLIQEFKHAYEAGINRVAQWCRADGLTEPTHPRSDRNWNHHNVYYRISNAAGDLASKNQGGYPYRYGNYPDPYLPEQWRRFSARVTKIING